MHEQVIYLDNAATSFPKPEGVYEAVIDAMKNSGGNPGRSGHKLSMAANKIINDARFHCARFFDARANHIVFTSNATAALNLALKGTLKSGDHVITSTIEHNSMSRPLHQLESIGVEVTKIPTDLTDGLSCDDIKKAIRKHTKMIVCTHISNVTGTINDIHTIGTFCRDNHLLFLVDAAQSAGNRPIDVQRMNIDMMAFPGHKGLFAPQGTGGLVVRPGVELEAIIRGGTGSKSETLTQPDTMPDKLESGTPNTPGLAGLIAGLHFIEQQGIEIIEAYENTLTTRLINGINSIKGIKIIGPGASKNRGNVISICFDKISPAEAALILDASFNISARSGLHCSADAHQYIGTINNGGTLRLSPGFFNTDDDIDQCINALAICAKGF